MRSFLQYLAVILLCFSYLSVEPLLAKSQFTVVIDPGHGGGDAGTRKRKGNMHEKAVALNVALRLGKKIEANYKDVKVVYTRKTDIYPSLPDRVAKAKEAKGDLFISIHVNACPDASARGFETYVFGVDGTKDAKQRAQERAIEERENLDINGKLINFDTDIDIQTKIICQAQREKHNKQSLEVAEMVQSSLISSIKKTKYASSVRNRGVKHKNLFVLCYSPMAAILVELGYMSNPAEEAFLTSDEGLESFANGIYRGFVNYKAKWDKRQLNAEDKAAPKDNGAEVKQDEKPADNTSKDADKGDTSSAGNDQATKPGDVEWRIQFLTSDRLLKEGAREFKGLKGVTYYKEGALYKYTYGSAASTAKLAAEKKKVDALFPNSFFVKFDKQGNRIK